MSGEEPSEFRRKQVKDSRRRERNVRAAERERERMERERLRRRMGQSPVSSDTDRCIAPSSGGDDEDAADRLGRQGERRSRRKEEAGTELMSDPEVTVRMRVNPVLMDGHPQDVTPPGDRGHART